MNLAEYQAITHQTEVVPGDASERLRVWRHGLQGEMGSVHTVFKKYNRDGIAYSKFRDHLITELGDVLWYVTAIARHFDISLPTQVASTTTAETGTLLLHLSHACDRLDKKIDNASTDPAGIQQALAEAVQILADISKKLDFTIETIANENVEKTRRRWISSPQSAAPQFDDDCEDYEQLPRSLTVEFREKPTPRGGIVILRANGINIGDRITDNSYDDDGYRFHDAFHLAYAATLGWSPVMRALFRCKRKGKGKKDEVEDGGRAIVIEEAISFQVYDYARELCFLDGVNRIDHDLLTRIATLVKGLEVENCAPWEWELAIIRGYEVFRALRKRGGGKVRIDASRRYLAVAD